jgi:hypothetical protein
MNLSSPGIRKATLLPPRVAFDLTSRVADELCPIREKFSTRRVGRGVDRIDRINRSRKTRRKKRQPAPTFPILVLPLVLLSAPLPVLPFC